MPEEKEVQETKPTKAEPARVEGEKKPEKKEPEQITFSLKEAEPWQKRRLFGSLGLIAVVFGVFLAVTCYQLYSDKLTVDTTWESYLNESSDLEQILEDNVTADTVYVETAVYLDQIRSVDIKNSKFEVVMEVAFRWEGGDDLDFTNTDSIRFYKGEIEDAVVVEELHEGTTHYVHMRYDVTINKVYRTPRFPLESHQLRIYLEPALDIKNVVFTVNADQSYTNSNLSVSGYDLTRFAVTRFLATYSEALLDPDYDNAADSTVYKTELMTQIEINRDGIGLYIKCCVALYGTLAWILLCMYVSTFRRVDSLGMIGSAFFGAVSNVMVGANLLPDALELGLVEYVNLYGILCILAGTAAVISINNIRRERNKDHFAGYYGRCVFLAMCIVIIVGNIAYPLCSYIF